MPQTREQRLLCLQQHGWKGGWIVSLRRKLQQAKYDALIRGRKPLLQPREKYLTVYEAAEAKGVSVATIKYAILQEVLPAEKPGDTLMILRSVLDATPIRGHGLGSSK